MRYNFHVRQFEDLEFNPEKVLFSGSDRDLNWREVHELVLKLEKIYSELCIPKAHPVMILGHKEAFYPVALLSLVHCGIPYIPVDRIYPEERLNKIISVTGSQVLINAGDYSHSLQIPFEIRSDLSVKKNGEANFSEAIYPLDNDELQYIMFTSGSTGEPKGVQISRAAVLSFIDWIKSDHPFTESDVYMNQSPFTFDVSLYDVLTALMMGSTVLLIDNDISRDPERLFAKLKKYNCSVWTSTPSFVYMYLRELNFNASFLDRMRIFLFAGEDLPPSTVRKLHQNFPSASVYNAYGPTEATVTTTLVKIDQNILESYDILPIGYPKRNCDLLVDEPENPGEKAGEIIITGPHVSVGYFKRDDLNQEKFTTHNGFRAFRTGDLGYYEDDLLFFIGRKDDQIKLHGYRIELGEISSVIRELPYVDDAVSLALKKGNDVKRIIAVIIMKADFSQWTNEEIKERVHKDISKKVPYYMIPGDIRKTDKYPINANHKIDRNKLIELYRTNQLG